LSKCLNAPILIAVPIREAIPVADRAQDPQDQAVLVLGAHPAPVRVDQAVLVMMIALRVVMIGGLLVIGLHVAILVTELHVGMIGVLMTGLHVATEQSPAQAVLALGDHLALVRVDLVVLVMMIVLRAAILVTGLHVGMTGVLMTVLRVVILVTGLHVGMTGVLVTGLRVVILVTGLRVGMIAAVLVIVLRVGMTEVLMTVRRVDSALVLVGRLVRAVMTVVMVGDEAVPVKKILLPASRVMRPSAGVQRSVPVVLVPFVRI
jgi:hypothetical protein